MRLLVRQNSLIAEDCEDKSKYEYYEIQSWKVTLNGLKVNILINN